MLPELRRYGRINGHRTGSVLIACVALRGIFFSLENRPANGNRLFIEVYVCLNSQGKKLSGPCPSTGCQGEHRAIHLRLRRFHDGCHLCNGEVWKLPLHSLGGRDFLPFDEPRRHDGFATLRHFVKLKVVDRSDDTEEILDGLAREVFPLPRLNQTPHDWISDFLERGVLQMWKDVLVQLARHAALRRTFLVDDEVMIFPSTSRQTKSNDWRLGASKM